MDETLRDVQPRCCIDRLRAPTLYWTLHAVRGEARPPRVGFIHFPLLPSMVVASGLEQPSMDFPVMLRAVETVLGVIARADDQAVRV